MSKEIKSPCISVCMLNAEDICEGCFRSAREITEWRTLDNDGKKQIMAAARERFARSNKHRLL